MGLIIGSNAIAAPVKHHGGVVHLTVPNIGHTACYDIHPEFCCQCADLRFHPFTVPIAQSGQVFFWEKAGIPCLRQHQHIRLFCHRIADHLPSMSKVFIRAAKLHIHLQANNLHIRHLPSSLQRRLAASFVSSGSPKAEKRKYPLPQAPKPSPGMPTT